jgi:hypothetical protein
VSSKSEPQPNAIGQEEEDRSKPAVWSDRVNEEFVADGRHLGEETSPAVAINAGVALDAGMAAEFML